MTTTPAPLRSRLRAAFTLIEMMVALALGLVIIGTVVAGLRVASRAFTLVNRLAQENQLMREGCEVAHEHLDFWTDYDDPDDAGNQRLRGYTRNAGMPFTPLYLVAPYRPGAVREADTGWNPAEGWAAADPRIWWHGQLAANDNSPLTMGRYSIFTNSSATLNVGNDPHGINHIFAYGQVNVTHNWLNNQLYMLYGALGYYGFFDYTPAGTIYQVYQPYNNSNTNWDGEPTVFDTPGGSFANSDGGQQYPFDLYRLTMTGATGLTSPTATTTSTPPQGPSPSMGRRYYCLDYIPVTEGSLLLRNPPPTDREKFKATFDIFNSDTVNAAPLIAGNGPATWPHVTVRMQRFIKTNRFVSVCRVTLTSPLTGDHVQLVWDGIGSTLRGARLQRGQKGGWAIWDDDPATVASNTKNLDDT